MKPFFSSRKPLFPLVPWEVKPYTFCTRQQRGKASNSAGEIFTLLKVRWKKFNQFKAVVSLLGLNEKQEKSSPKLRSLPYKSQSQMSTSAWPAGEATCFFQLLCVTEREQHLLLEIRNLLLVLRCPCLDLTETLGLKVMWYLLTCKPLKRESLGVRQDNCSSAPEPSQKGRLTSVLQMINLIQKTNGLNGVLMTLSFIFLPQNVFENFRKPLGQEVDESKVTLG